MVNKKTKNPKRTRKILIAIGVIVFVVLFIPGPFKPSVWSYIHLHKLNRNLSKYTAPVYITPQAPPSNVSFDTYLSWNNSYAVRGFADNKSHAGGYFYYQLAKDGSYGDTPEGPSELDMQPYVAAINMDCPQHVSGIQMCAINNPELYIAKFDVGEAYLVSDLTQRVFNKDKLDSTKYPMPHDYFPPSEEEINDSARLLLSARPLPLNQAKKYFKPQF